MNNKKNTDRSSLNGWLILPFIGLILSPFSAFIELNLPLRPSEVIISGVIGLFCTWLAVQFLRKQYFVPSWMVVFYSINLISAAILFAFWEESEAEERIQSISFIILATVVSLIWIPYFFFSKRVKETFLYHGKEVLNEPNQMKHVGKKIALTTVVYFLIAALAGVVESVYFPRYSLEEVYPAVVNIYCKSSNEEMSMQGGSGVLFSSEGVMLTNAHIFPQDDEYYYLDEEDGCVVILPNEQGESGEMYWAQPYVFIGPSEEYDLAILKIYAAYKNEEGEILGTITQPFPEYACENYDVKLGDEVRILGYPQINEDFEYENLVVTEGIVSSISEDYIFTSAQVEKGSSGGMAIDEHGCMIGVPSGVMSGEYQTLGMIIPMQRVIDFLDIVTELEEESNEEMEEENTVPLPEGDEDEGDEDTASEEV